VTGIGDSQNRTHRYAAHPGEHVATPNVFTTIFPHLASHRVHEFRYAFLGGIVVLALLYGFGLIVAGILVSAVLVPILYLIYLYEAQVYRDEPALVLGTTFGLGAILGVVVTLVTSHVFNPVQRATGEYASTGGLLIATVVIPVIQLLFLGLPALLLRRRPTFEETADGLVLGVAAGLGFSAAETIVRFSDTITNTDVRVPSAGWIYPLLSIAIFIPLLHGTGAGIIAASLWPRSRQRRSRGLARLGVIAALVITVAFFVVGSLIRTANGGLGGDVQNGGSDPLLWLGWQAVAVGLLIVYLRFLLHYALLDEAKDLGFSAQICANCHKHMMAGGFCPACGMALSAGPRRRGPGWSVETAAEDSVEPTVEGA